jgi:hypothetical protein
MSLRPPATYWELYNATDGSTSGGSTAWPQAAGPVPDTLKNIQTRSGPGGTLHLQGVWFLANSGNFVATPSQVPTGQAPAAVTVAGPASDWIEFVPTSIDPATTMPFLLAYGPLGPGAR